MTRRRCAPSALPPYNWTQAPHTAVSPCSRFRTTFKYFGGSRNGRRCTIHSPWLLRYEYSSTRLWWDATEYCGTLEYSTWCRTGNQIFVRLTTGKFEESVTLLLYDLRMAPVPEGEMVFSAQRSAADPNHHNLTE